MFDCVVDATVVYKANGDITTRRVGTVFDKRLSVIEEIGSGARRLRYNPKLLIEYERVAKQRRNDVIELFFAVLAERAILVRRNTLAQHDNAKAKECHWPSHDRHLLAAAVDGDQPSIVVTERQHVKCAKCILRRFAVHLEDMG